MASKGRKAGFHMGPEHRAKIANSMILSNLIKFAEGEVNCPIDYQQAQVGLGLLRKVMPDMTENHNTHDVTDSLQDLLEKVAQGGKRIGS